MRRRKKPESRIDLIGFLDIISVLNVLILLIISIMSLELGVRDSRRISKTNPSPTKQPLARVITNGGIRVTSPVSFLMCSDQALTIHDPNTGAVIKEFSQNDTDDMRALLTSTLEARVYLAVKPSCFQRYKLIATMVKSTGSSIGMEPIPESASSPWGSAGF